MPFQLSGFVWFRRQRTDLRGHCPVVLEKWTHWFCLPQLSCSQLKKLLCYQCCSTRRPCWKHLQGSVCIVDKSFQQSVGAGEVQDELSCELQACIGANLAFLMRHSRPLTLDAGMLSGKCRCICWVPETRGCSHIPHLQVRVPKNIFFSSCITMTLSTWKWEPPKQTWEVYFWTFRSNLLSGLL